jgi:hypothetical protein
VQQSAGDPQFRNRQLGRQCRMGWGRVRLPDAIILGQPANIIDRHRRNQSNSGRR